jgi:Macrocin-O-methyltransferase (TylF)
MKAIAAVPGSVKQWCTRTLRRAGYQLVNLEKMYEFDGLHTVHNARFRENRRFQMAYGRALQAGRGVDPQTAWRIHIGLWAASAASRIPGDFVECGVNAGFLSSAILRYLDWDRLGKKFYLVDTFEGPVPAQFSEEEIGRGRLAAIEQALSAGAYVTDLERVRQNYSEWRRIEIVKGCVPDVLPAVDTDSIAFLHLDMNCAYPEAAALRHFWPYISGHGIVLFDDYCYFGHDEQATAIDEVAAEFKAEVLVLPTGQGMILK